VHDFAIEDSHGNVVEWNVNVGGDVSANFNIVLSDKANEADDTKIVVSYNGTTKEISKSEWQNGTTTDGAACVKLPVDMIAPHMNDVITIQVVADGTSGGEQTFTIREYAEAIINGNFDDNTKNLAKHMLNYGAKSQTYFNYKTDDLANKTVETQKDSSALAALEGDNKTIADTFATLTQVADYNTAFMDLESGACDAIAMDIGVAEYDIKNKNSTVNFTILNDTITTEKYGVGFKQGNTELRNQVQATLDEMFVDGTFVKIAEKYGISPTALIQG
jgi:hypothetical protein